jgi:hypothetical protein
MEMYAGSQGYIEDVLPKVTGKKYCIEHVCMDTGKISFCPQAMDTW